MLLLNPSVFLTLSYVPLLEPVSRASCSPSPENKPVSWAGTEESSQGCAEWRGARGECRGDPELSVLEGSSNGADVCIWE